MSVKDKQSLTGFKGNNKTNPIHSGGFKYNPTHSQSQIQSQIRSSSNHKQSKSKPSDFYDSFGIQSNIDKMKQNRFNNLQKQLAKGFDAQLGNNLLKIYDGAGRKQQASHIPSSLLQPTLQNVQAQLQAHRIALKPLEQKYFDMKGLKNPYNIQQSNLNNIQISAQQQTKQLIYKLKHGQVGAKNKKQMQEQQLQRMFEQRKKLDPKLAQYDRKFRQYKIQKQAIQQNKAQQLHLKQNQRKQHLSNKKISKDKQILQRYKEQQEDNMEIIDLQNKYDVSKVLATNNDKFIVKYIFKQIDKQKKQLISKQQLHDYLIQNQQLFNNFKIDKKWFYSDLEIYETKRKGLLSLEQTLKFLIENKIRQHPQLQLVDPSVKISPYVKNNCLLGTSQLNRLEQLFKSIDKQDDKIVKREELISIIYNDQYIISRLNNPAIKIHQINKTVTIKQILELILNQYRSIKNQSKKKAKQYITLKQFMDYFNDINVDSLENKTVDTQQSIIYDIDQEHLELIKDIFDRIPRVYQNYIVVQDFIEECRRDPQYKLITEEIARIQSVQTKLPAQSIKSVMNRINTQTDQYENWNTIQLFFSRRGRPLGWDLQKIKKKRQIRQKQKKQQFNKMIKGLNIEQKQKYLDALAVNTKSKSKQSFNSINYTFPQPFDITDQRKKSKGKIHCDGMLDGQKEFDELKAGIQSLPLNKQILQPRLQQIQRKRKLRSQKNKQQNKKKLIKQSQPFSFHDKQMIAKILKQAQDKQKLQNQKKQQGIKPKRPPSNLKKTYKQIMQQQQKERQKKKPLNNNEKQQISDRLYPNDPSNLNKQKNKKVLQKMKKLQQIKEKMKQQSQKQKNRLNDKNRQKQRKLKQMKENQERQRKQRQREMDKNENLDYKPKIKDYDISGQAEEGKKRRQEKQRQQIEQRIKRKQQERNKRLKYEPKQQPKLDIQNMDEQDIIDRLSEISLSDLLEEEEKQIWIKRRNFQKIPFSNKYKANKERQKAIMMRQRKHMEQQQKMRRQQLRNKLQSDLDKKKQGFEKSITNQIQKNKDKRLDPKSVSAKMNFNKSRALRRYYDLMQGKVPLSEYDRLSHEARTVISEAEILKIVQENQNFQDN